MKHKFIYNDLNEVVNNRVLVINPLTFKEIFELYGEVFSGMQLYLWTDDLGINEKYDPMVYTGLLELDTKEKRWYIKIDDVKKIKHLSESEEFKDYSLKDVLGERDYNEVLEKHPEWL